MPASTFWLALLFAAAGLLPACASEPAAADPARAFVPLVELEDWRSVAREDDPFVAAGEAPADCVASGVFVEEQWLEIDTGVCNWVTLVAPARFAVSAEQQLRIVVSHYDLNAPSAAEGEAELRLGACEAWSKLVEIPSPAAVYAEPFVSACSIDEGDDVYFHLHNHGQNNWQLQELSVER